MRGCSSARELMEIADHRLTGTVTQLSSLHTDVRPADVSISLIVVHGISLPAGHFGGHYIERLFTGGPETWVAAHPDFADLAGVRVSSHLLIRRNGAVLQFAPFDTRAWHAGDSCHNGQTNCNDFSIGIELEGTDNDPYRREQYEQLVAIIRLLAARYPITAIVGHSDIAPARKTDPGPAFDWHYLDGLIGKRAGYTLPTD